MIKCRHRYINNPTIRSHYSLPPMDSIKSCDTKPATSIITLNISSPVYQNDGKPVQNFDLTINSEVSVMACDEISNNLKSHKTIGKLASRDNDNSTVYSS